MIIALASDHADFSIRSAEIVHRILNHTWVDYGDESKRDATIRILRMPAQKESFAVKANVEFSFADQESEWHGRRKASRHQSRLLQSLDAARLSRLHNDANVLCIGSRLSTWEEATAMVVLFLATGIRSGAAYGPRQENRTFFRSAMMNRAAGSFISFQKTVRQASCKAEWMETPYGAHMRG